MVVEDTPTFIFGGGLRVLKLRLMFRKIRYGTKEERERERETEREGGGGGGREHVKHICVICASVFF